MPNGNLKSSGKSGSLPKAFFTTSIVANSLFVKGESEIITNFCSLPFSSIIERTVLPLSSLYL